MIYINIPYVPNGSKNIGAAYNQFMNLIGDDDWACFLDADAMFVTGDFYKQLEEIIIKPENENIGMYTACTNRIGNIEQIVFGKKSEEARNHDIEFHREIGKALQNTRRYDLIDCKDPISGVVMLISKKAWSKTKGFADGFLGVDNNMDYQLRNIGYRTCIMLGVYVYHWYRYNYLKVGGLKPNGYV